LRGYRMITTMNVCILFAIVISELVSSSKSATPIFKSNAADFIEAGFKKTIRRGLEKQDFTKIEISARPLLMVQDVLSIEKNHVTLEIKSQDEDWKIFTENPSIRGGVYKWTFSNIEPCINHNIRIWVHGMDESKASFNYPTMISGANQEDLAASGYRPHMPQDVQIEVYSEGELEVSWTPAKCASLYDVSYQTVTRGKTISKQVQGNSIILTDGLEPCNEYEIRVSAVIGDEYSEENIVTFLTPPQTNAAGKLEPVTQITSNSVVARWNGFKQLSCISEYIVTLCRVGETCSEGEKVKRDDSLLLLEYKSDYNLEECSDYTLHIKPVHNQVAVKEKLIKFRTASPAAKSPKFAARYSKETNEVVFDWPSIRCASGYKVHQRTENGEIKTIWESENEDNLYLSLKSPEPCLTYSYSMSALFGSQESIPTAWTDIPVPPRVGILENPTLVIEEKTNGSVTFVINNNDKNHRCKVEKYHVKYSTEEVYIDPITLEDEKITVIVSQENTEIEGRLKYQGFETWTPWISSNSPMKEKKTGGEIGFLLPIIIGSVVALASLTLLVFLVIRNKKSQEKYDEEKADGNTDESKKLNDQVEEKDSKEKDIINS